MTQNRSASRATEFPAIWGETEHSGDANWRQSTALVDVPLDETEALLLATTIRSNCPSATLEKVARIQNRGLWQSYRCAVRTTFTPIRVLFRTCLTVAWPCSSSPQALQGQRDQAVQRRR